MTAVNAVLPAPGGSIAAAAAGVSNTTVFSTRPFVEWWCRFVAPRKRALAIPVRGSGPDREMFAFETRSPGGVRWIELAADDFQASPGWVGALERETVGGVLRQLMGFRTTGFRWHVRFDHGALAAQLEAHGLPCTHRQPTQVVYLDADYERVFAGYSSMTRNHVRRARRQGVVVRDAQGPEEVRAYHDIYLRMVRQKSEKGEGWLWFVYPLEMLQELTRMEGVRLILAECEGKVAAGGVFIRDGESMLYFSGASDREYSRFYAANAVMDEAIRWGCAGGAGTMDMVNSGGLAELERYKASWGARAALNWSFQWANPMWQPAIRLKRVAERVLDVYRRKSI